MRTIRKIIVHCSLSSWGNAAVIDEWHKERGWKGIGYHYVILNGNLSPDIFSVEYNGIVEEGRPIEQSGAHVKGMNLDTIGICLIGVEDFTKNQIKKLDLLLYYLCREYSLTRKDILGHYETPTGTAQGKTCPNIDMVNYRKKLSWLFPIYTFGFYRPRLEDLVG